MCVRGCVCGWVGVCGERDRDRERQILLGPCHCGELAGLKSEGAALQAGNSSRSQCCSLEFKGKLKVEFLPLPGTPGFSLKASH